jgi:hypothetical protein
VVQVSARVQETVSLIAFPSNVVCELPCSSRAVARGEVDELDTQGIILLVRKYDKQGRAGVCPSRVPRKRFLF